MFRSLRGASACGRVSPSVCLSRIRSPLADRATYLYVRALLVVVCRLAPACRTRCVWEACAGPASVRATSARVLRYVDLPNLPFMAISSLLPFSYFLWRVLHLTVPEPLGSGSVRCGWGRRWHRLTGGDARGAAQLRGGGRPRASRACRIQPMGKVPGAGPRILVVVYVPLSRLAPIG